MVSSGGWHVEADGRRVMRLRLQEKGRVSSVTFLLVWLVFWTVGEVVVGYLLVAGAISLAAGRPLWSDGQALALGPAVAAGAFMVVWLAFWTLAGVLALREMLRLVWSEDRIAVTSGGILVDRRRGPLRSRVEVPRGAVQRVALSGSGAVLAETATGTVEITGLGAAEQRARLAGWLRSELDVPDLGCSTVPAAVPDGWQEITTEDGAVALVSDLGRRRRGARLAAAVAAAAAAVALVLVVEAVRDQGLVVLAIMASVAAGGLGWLALGLVRRRHEWVYGDRRLVLRRRTGARARDLFEAVALDLSRRHDGDGDAWYDLEALAGGTTSRRSVVRSIHDPTEPRRLGLWLAARTGVPFTDRATSRDRDAELAEALAQLEDLGRPGQRLAKILKNRAGKDGTGVW